MIKIIVAEDEYFARKVLVKMLQELDEEIEIIGEAENGLEVLAILAENRADIVITDIHMPDMDGLDLAKELSENHENIKVIIETGFAEFDYATRAIRYGVSDYLLKPIKKDELHQAIRRIVDSSKKSTERLKTKLELRRTQYMDFTHVLENKELSEQILGEFFAKMQEKSWYIGVVQCCSRQLAEAQIQSILELLERQDGDIEVHAGFFYPKEEFIIVFNATEADRESISMCMHKKEMACINFLGLEVEAGISRMQPESQNPMKDAAAAYREAVYAMNQRLLNPGRQLYFYDPEVNIKCCFTQAEERNLEQYLIEGRVKEAEQLIDGFFRKCRETDRVNAYSLFISIVQIINVMNRVYNRRQAGVQQEKESALLFSFKADLYGYRTLDEIREYIGQILHDVCGEEEQKSSIIADLLKYLEWNYQYDITVHDLAMHKYFVSPSYLSRLFKAETGQPFSRYLIDLRMKKAAQMLEDSNLKVSDVAVCVGYNDVSYFIQTFKKYYDMTPEQYKKGV